MDKALRLKIVIVGGGLASFALAIALAEKGHSVTVIESAVEFSHFGAGLHVAPNAARILVRMGLRAEMEKFSMNMKKLKIYRYTDGTLLFEQSHENVERQHGAPFWQIHRGDLHTILQEHAGKLGVSVMMGTRIASYDFETPSLVLVDGQILSADIIVAADGIRSQARSLMLGQNDEPRDTGNSVYRILVPSKLLQDDSDVVKLITDEATHVWTGEGRNAVGYTIRGGEYFNFGFTQQASELLRGNDIYTAPKDPKDILEEYKGWDPRLMYIVSRAEPERVVEWKVCDHEPLETWHRGKVVLIGDACHPMLPAAGQGACMAIEDGAALAVLLDRMQSVEEIPAVLKAFEDLRLPRCTRVSEIAVDNSKKWRSQQQNQHGTAMDWLYGYDAEDEARKVNLPRWGGVSRYSSND